MNEIEIPWTQIGAFGSFAIIVLALVLYFVFKSRKARSNNPGTINRAKCINDPRVQIGLTDLAMSKEAMGEMKGDMKMLREKSIEQTNVLGNIYDETKDQTKVLERIADKIGKK